MSAEKVVPIRPTTGANTSAGILDSDGSTWVKIPPGQGAPPPSFDGGGGGGDMTRRITIEQNVKGLNIWVSLLTAGFCGAFLFLLLRIDDRFDRADAANSEMAKQITAVLVEDAKQSTGIAEILERVRQDDDLKKSAGSEQPDTVR